MGVLAELFTWWNGQTLGTRLYTSRMGKRVGQDDQGNIYYQTADGQRRWVIYNGTSEASCVPPEWHGWLHKTVDDVPSDTPVDRKPWQLAHQPNLTGTPAAYVPPGSQLTPEGRPKVAGDYEAWQPE